MSMHLSTPSTLPTLISKGELARRLCLVSADDHRTYPFKLGRDYFSDEILQKMGLTRSEYNRIKVFNRKQTLFIYEYLKDELE
ncbi:MAG: hypothetical protein RLZZ628_2888 [Bacteroidota bacterium]|jgi:hypothetical protein